MSHEATDQSFQPAEALEFTGALKLTDELNSWHWLALATGFALIAGALLL